MVPVAVAKSADRVVKLRGEGPVARRERSRHRPWHGAGTGSPFVQISHAKGLGRLLQGFVDDSRGALPG
jgi:hypothetical protein